MANINSGSSMASSHNAAALTLGDDASVSDLWSSDPPSPSSMTYIYSSPQSTSGLRCFPHTNIRIPDTFIPVKPAERLREIKLQESKKRTSDYAGFGRKRLPDELLKRPRTVRNPPCTKLWGYKPVKTEIPQDIWREILTRTDPCTVWNIRNTCRSFRDIIHNERFLKDNREIYFGSDAPPKPKELNEYQFSDLLFGQGCQLCGTKKTKRAVWVFRRRWCEACLKKQIVKCREAGPSVPRLDWRYPRLSICLPRALIGKFDTYLCTAPPWSDPDNVPLHGSHDPGNPWPLGARYDVALKTDFEALRTEWRQQLELHGSDPLNNMRDDPKRKWILEKAKSVLPILESAKAIEAFVDKYLKEEKVTPPLDKLERQWRDRLSDLKPPLSLAAFKLMPGAMHALTKKPVGRSWKAMEPRISQYRELAEQQVNEVKELIGERDYHSLPTSVNKPKPKPGAAKEMLQPNNARLKRIANSTIESLANTRTADEDFIHVALRKIREEYFADGLRGDPSTFTSMPHGLSSYSGEMPAHLKVNSEEDLTLYDAQQVYVTYLLPHVKVWGILRSKQALRFKCPGCTRRDYSKSWNFDDLLVHLGSRHGGELGSIWFECFKAWQVHGNTPEYFKALEWPPNFPMLAQHHVATGEWDFGSDIYVTKEESAKSKLESADAVSGSPPLDRWIVKAPRMRIIGSLERRPEPIPIEPVPELAQNAFRFTLPVHPNLIRLGRIAMSSNDSSSDEDSEFDSDMEDMEPGMEDIEEIDDSENGSDSDDVDADTLTAAHVLTGLAPRSSGGNSGISGRRSRQ